MSYLRRTLMYTWGSNNSLPSEIKRGDCMSKKNTGLLEGI